MIKSELFLGNNSYDPNFEDQENFSCVFALNCNGYSDEHCIYYAPVVLVAPETFPANKSMIYDTFKVKAKFTGDDGTTEEKDISLRIEHAPVILIPGMINPSVMNMFGTASLVNSLWNSGDAKSTFAYGKYSILKELWDRGFKNNHIVLWDHNGRKGIRNLVGYDYNPLYETLSDMFDKYAEEGIVCTKADVVAHGMGGLIVRQFIAGGHTYSDEGNNLTTRSYRQGMIHRFISIAVPHQGTPWANVMCGDFSVVDNVAMGNDALAQTVLWMLHNKYLSLYTDPFLKEIAVGSNFMNNLFLSENVPMHFIYGDVTGALKTLENVKNVTFAVYNLAKFAKSLKDMGKYLKLSEYEDFVKVNNAIEQSNPKNTSELLQTINKLDDKILLRVASQKEEILKELLKNYRNLSFSFAEMISQNPQVTGFFELAETVSTIVLDGISNLNPASFAFNLYFSSQRVIFSGEAHDMFVPVSSAIAGRPAYSTGFPETISGNFVSVDDWLSLRYKYATICQQADVAFAVAQLLRKNSLDDFIVINKNEGLSANNLYSTAPTPVMVKTSSENEDSDSSSDEIDYSKVNFDNIDFENLYVKKFALKADQNVVVLSNSDSESDERVIKFTASIPTEMKNEVSLVIQKDGLDSVFMMFTDDNKNFEVNIGFVSSDMGDISAYCYAPSDEGQIYISEPIKISLLHDFSNEEVQEINFFGAGRIYTNVNSEIPAGLYAVTRDGNVFEVSSPLNGTQWTAENNSVVKITDNGGVLGLSEGETNLTATFKGLTASVKVAVAYALDDDYNDGEDDPNIDNENKNQNQEQDQNSTNSGESDSSGSQENSNSDNVDAPAENNSDGQNESKGSGKTKTQEEIIREILNFDTNVKIQKLNISVQTEKSTPSNWNIEKNGTPLKIFDEIEVAESGFYIIECDFEKTIPTGTNLIWYPNPENIEKTNNSEKYVFLDESNEEITLPTLNALNYMKIVAYFEAGKKYSPILAEVSDEKSNSVSSNGGCNSGFALIIWVLLIFNIAFRKFRKV